MTLEELKTAVLALDSEQKQAFIRETLPDLLREGMKEPSFLGQLFPIFMEMIRESGLDIQQLLQFAATMGAKRP